MTNRLSRYRGQARGKWRVRRPPGLAAGVVTVVLAVVVAASASGQISAGATPYGKGTVTTDGYSTAGSAVHASAVCTAGAACTRGAWQVMPVSGQVRAARAVLLYNGKVLLVAGSGNDIKEFNEGTFKTAVYDPSRGTLTQIPAPADLDRAGEVQLPDGKVLVLGGNKAYPVRKEPSREKAGVHDRERSMPP